MMQQESGFAKRIWYSQLILVVIVAIVLVTYANVLAAKSALLAGLVFLIPSRLFLAKFFQQRAELTARQVVKQLYLGEFLKIVATFGLLAVVLVWVPIAGLPFFLTYLALQTVYWFALLI